MKKIIFVCFLLLLFLGIACKKNAEGPRVEVVEGVTYIQNTEAPRYADRTVSFLLDLTIGGDDVSSEGALYQLGSFTVDSSGFIYISDREDMTIKVFDPDGVFVRTIGQRGEGPGEFQSIGRMGFLPDGRLLVLDSRARRTNIFSSDGEFLQSHKWLTSRNFLLLSTNSSYTTNENIFGEENQVFVKTYDFSGEELLSFGQFTPTNFKTVRQGNAMFGTNVPHSPLSVFTGDQGRQWLYHCLNDKYVIEVFDQKGKLFRKISRPYTPLPFTKKDEEEFRARAEDTRNEAFAKLYKEMSLPKVKTITRQMFVDDRGNLWIKTFEEREEGGRTLNAYDIFNHEGYYEAKIWSDLSPIIILRGKMYRLDTNEESGFRTLKRYRVVWN